MVRSLYKETMRMSLWYALIVPMFHLSHVLLPSPQVIALVETALTVAQLLVRQPRQVQWVKKSSQHVFESLLFASLSLVVVFPSALAFPRFHLHLRFYVAQLLHPSLHE